MTPKDSNEDSALHIGFLSFKDFKTANCKMHEIFVEFLVDAAWARSQM